MPESPGGCAPNPIEGALDHCEDRLRIGPAELESAALDHPSVAEAAAIGVPHEVKGETPWIFVALKPDAEQDADGIKAAVAAALGKAFAPERILFVSGLPKTRSAKIVRRAVRATALGEDPGDLSSLENPDSLEEIERALAKPGAAVRGGATGLGSG